MLTRCRGALPHNRCGPGYLPGRLCLITQPTVTCRLYLYMCEYMFIFVVLVNKFLNFFNFLSVFSCHLQVMLDPGPRAVKPPHSFATRGTKNFKVSLTSVHKLFSISTGRNKPPPETPESQATATIATSYIHVLSLQRHRHGLAGRAPPPRDPCPAITVCCLDCQRLVRPYTSVPHSLKNQ